MTCTTVGKEIVRGTICRDRWNITVLLNHSGVVPLNRLSHLGLSIDWHPDTDDRAVVLVLRSQTPSSGGQVRFGGADGPDRRTFTGDGDQLIALYGSRASAGTEPDVFLDVIVDEDVRHSLGLRVQAQTQVNVDTALARLEAELAIAAQPARPTDAALQPVWDRYARLFADAHQFADALSSLPSASIPAVAGSLDARPFDLDEIKTHLRHHGRPQSIAETKGQGRNDAFDPFRGHWRGDWRQQSDCPTAFRTCQDHQWGDTVALATQPHLYVQRVRLGEDSRPYREGAEACTALTDATRDVTQPALNLINIETGVIVGAVGLRETPDRGTVAQRPHVGFYIAPGRLLWVAEEHLSADGSEVTYSVFYEIREGDSVDQPLYTIQGFELRWHRGESRIQGEITTKAGQYLKIMTAEERQLEQQFRDRALQPGHLEQPYYRRQLERLSPDDVRAFQNNAATSATVRPYLERLLDFVTQQKALAEAPLGPRPAVTFIMGEEPEDAANQFYSSARNFFDLNPAGTLVTNLRNLVQVRDYLNRHAPAAGPWGEINIVVHANEEGGMSIPVRAGGNDIFPELLEQAIADGDILPLDNDQVDVRTQVRVRGCALGRSQEILELLSVALGSRDLQHPVVRAPQGLQSYNWQSVGGTLTEVEEHLVEFWFVSWPGTTAARPARATLAQQFRDKYRDHPVDFDWEDALRGRVPGITQETRDRSLPYAPIAIPYAPADLPPLGTSAQRRAALLARTTIEAELNADGYQIADFNWVIGTAQRTLSNSDIEVTFTINAQRTILRLERDLRAQLSAVLFTLSSSLQTDLTTRTLSPALRQAFTDAGHPLSDVALVLIREVNQQWLIVDPAHPLLHQPANLRTFLVRRTDTNLTVRREDPLSTGAVVRAHPPVTDLQHFGEYVPARPATHPLGENIPP
ncbi:MAG: hypothetical protein WBA99_12880 [Nodosilinea sp.]